MTLGGVETTHAYDPRGRLIETKQGGSRITYSYDTMGRRIVTRTYYGSGEDDFIVKACAFDVLNQVVEEREEDSAGNVLKKSQYEYDIAGNRSRTIEYSQAGPSVTLMKYDPYGNPLEVIDPLGNRTVTCYDYNTRNAMGQIVPYEETTDSLGTVSATTKDALGRVVSVLRKNALGRKLQKAEFFYDANGNRTRQVDTVFNPDYTTREVITAWQYDPCNRLIGLTEAVGTPEQKHTQTLYNSYGQKECLVKPDGVLLCYTYDQLGRLHTHYSTDGTVFYRYTYDVRGNVVQVEDLIQGVSTMRQYDNDDNLVAETLANGIEISYTYDNMGRPLTTLLPDATGIRYAYRVNLLEQVQRCDNKGEPTFTHMYEKYDMGGLLLQEKYAGMAVLRNIRMMF